MRDAGICASARNYATTLVFSRDSVGSKLNGRKVNVVHDSSYDCSGIGQVYKFLRRAFDDSTAELEFQNFLQGNLSEKILERAREWIEQDRRLRACEEAANLRQTF